MNIMIDRKNILTTAVYVLAASFLSSAFAVMLVFWHYRQLSFELLNAVCGEMLEQDPDAKKIIAISLKAYTNGNVDATAQKDILSTLGYRITDFSGSVDRQNIIYALTGFMFGAAFFLFAFLYRNKVEALRIQSLTDYLAEVNAGKAGILSATGEDDFSKLEDEIYKTVTYLYKIKDAAVQTKNSFAENLSNIAHQLKTPITAVSLSVQTMQKEYGKDKIEQINKQLLRLTHLEEALLILSRLDAGILQFCKKEIDIFTVLVLAADNLQEIFADSGTSIEVPELGGMAITADPDWTMEAIMNLMKNCMEHHAGGIVHCSYGQNPLYTEILIWDDGEGFSREDIPHLFERFYRGKNAREGGIGIGLALAKEIIERQNGTIRAKNLWDGGACFEIRFYCH